LFVYAPGDAQESSYHRLFHITKFVRFLQFALEWLSFISAFRKFLKLEDNSRNIGLFLGINLAASVQQGAYDL
jgi:hypothetical protein